MITSHQQLQIIQRLSGLTQEKLAKELGVSFVTLNSWLRERSLPRAKARAQIEALYRDYTGQKIIPSDLLQAKKQLVLQQCKLHHNVLKTILSYPDISDQFTLSLTYNTNRIEGSSLTEPETAAILFQGIALPDKTIREQLEVKNHQTALAYVWKILSDAPVSLDEPFILKLHSILMNSILPDAGSYRRHGVCIVGANIPTANYLKVPSLMQTLVTDIHKKSEDLVAQLATIHARFEQIHPFSDGNGRIGRLLMVAMAVRFNLAPPVIVQEKRQFYYTTLAKAQQSGDASLLEDFICEATLRGCEILGRK
jgi:Fic family protein